MGRQASSFWQGNAFGSCYVLLCCPLAQLAVASGFGPEGSGFESQEGNQEGVMGYKNKADKAAYELRRYYQRREEAFDQLGRTCSCGQPAEEIDHIDPSTKSFSISVLWSIAKERREAELLKCQSLCSPCHKAKSAAEQSKARRGEGNPHAKLTRAQVEQIRNRYTPYCRTNGARALSREFGVTKTTITLVVTNQTWA